MKTSAYFEKALFYDDAAAIEDYFERRVGQLFEQTKERSYIEFHIQLPSHKINIQNKIALEAVAKTPEWDSGLESDGSVDPSSPAEHSCFPNDPPRYIGAPVLRRRISNVETLTELAKVGSV